MEGWLQCVVSPGQFTSEFGVRVKTHTGEAFLFAPREAIELPDEAAQDDYVGNALIRVEIVDQKGELFMVRLPRRTLENGQYITVDVEAIRQEA